MTIYNAIRGQPVDLGRQGEHLARRVVFDISDWVRDFGAGTVQLLHQRQEDAAPYPVSVTRTDADGVTVNDETGTLLLWDVTNADAATRQRYGRAELRYYSVGDGGASFLAKSETYRTFVADALGVPTVEDMPEPAQDWIQTLLSQTDVFTERFDKLNDALATVKNTLESAEAQAQSAAETGALVYNTFCRTVSGDPCVFTASAAAGLASLTVHIVPTQDGTPSVESPVPIAGYDSLRLFLTANQATELYATTLLDDGIHTDYEGSRDITTGFIPYLPSQTYKVAYLSRGDTVANTKQFFAVFFYNENRNLLSKVNLLASGEKVYAATVGFTWRLLGVIENGPSDAREMRLCFYNAYSGTTDGQRDMVFVGGTQINRLTQSFFQSARIADVYDISLSFGGTVYGGSLDVISGVLTVTHDCIESYNAETVPDGWISSTGQLSNGAQVVYPLDTPVTIQLAPMELAVVSGFNSIYSDAGSVTAVYWSDYASREELTNGLAEKISKTPAGSAVKGIYLDENGNPAAMTHSLESDVPTDAVFTDTTYQNATSSAAGLMSAADKTKLDGIETGAQANLIESVSVNGNAAPINNKAVTISTLTQSDVQSLINDALADFTGVSFLPVNALPASGESGVFYLVPNGSNAQNAYDEYIWIASANRFEKIGTAEIDLSGYAHTADIPTKTSDLTNDSGFITAQDIAGKQDSASQEAIDAAQNSRLTAVESENALLRELISGIDAPIYRTASGAPATFPDGYANVALRNLTVTLTPTQSGSGDPSPDNVRPISGYNSVTVTRTDADGAQSANLQTVTVTLTDGTDPLTVYGGTLDVISGTLSVDTLYAAIPAVVSNSLADKLGNKVWRVYASHSGVHQSYVAGSVVSDTLKVQPSITGNSSITTPAMALNAERDLRWCVPGVTTREDALAWLADHPVHFTYRISEPVTYQLTPVSVTSLLGYNSVSADAGTLSVTYRADPSISLP